MGKVHGSLARAGKVKSQTPKVDPQEKPKSPKGRAHKRELYTRRFVNVTAVLPNGKRKVREAMDCNRACLMVADECATDEREPDCLGTQEELEDQGEGGIRESKWRGPSC
ncbi:hypothetical protein N658DRAFT_431472 [Parathielavia hyrcaniae]|uniref:40S ribosomal protein S30 n=1 Tax=Parathielavia hyrcaniae TaxID=113614 RepID=A0AAN6PXV7_9PEZI|nr:hypothetical protein N658DRAFT_431472 [Parathielavia hyrcaniae]